MRVIYLHGIAGLPELSPAIKRLEAGGVEVVAPVLPGFDGAPGWEAPADYLGWLTLTWDTLDATGALPAAVIGASTGGMLAADLAALRPEAVTRLALLAPLGIWDGDHPGADPYGVPRAQRFPMLFAGSVPEAFPNAFDERGPLEQPVSQHLRDVAGASLVWPLPDRGLATRVHRITAPTMVLWGAEDRIAPPALASHWPATERVVVPGAGHLLEWDAPDAVADALIRFLDDRNST